LLSVAAGYDEQDAYSRRNLAHCFDFGRAGTFRFRIPRADQLQFFGNQQAATKNFSAADAYLGIYRLEN